MDINDGNNFMDTKDGNNLIASFYNIKALEYCGRLTIWSYSNFPLRDILRKKNEDFPEEISHSIVIVLRLYDSRMIFPRE